MTLYKLVDDKLKLYEMLACGEYTEEELADTLEGNQGDIEDKFDGYGKIIRNLETDIASLKSEEGRLKARRESMENSVGRLKKALEGAMRATGQGKVKTELFTFNIQKNPASLKLNSELDFDAIPAEYVIFPEPTIDKEAVKKAIKAGAEFDWAHMEQGESLRIK